MSNNAINVRPVYRDSLGSPRAEGLVYFYVNKTTELAEIFSDELLSVAQANPYTLNAYGAIDGDVKYSGKLTVTHTNKDGSDPISDDDVESQGGSVSDAFVDQFSTIENSPADMAVIIEAGRVMDGETLVSVAAQTTTLIVAPISNPRIDRVVVDRLTGVYTIVTGAESATPAAPAIPAGKMPSAQISLTTSTSSIVEADITDERISGSVEPSNANSTETLTNKTIGDGNTINAQDDAFTIDDATDGTKQIDFDAAGTTGTKTTITSSQTANRVITTPDATDTLVGRATIDTLTNKTLTLPQINDTSSDHQYIFTVSELAADRSVNLPLLTSGDEFTFNDHAQTLTNKTVSFASNTLTGVQAQGDGLDDISALSAADGNIIVGGGANWVAESGATARTSLGLTIGSDVQAYSPSLDTVLAETTNTALGSTALDSNTTGINNTAVGYFALTANTIGTNNTAVGYQSMELNTTGVDNTAVGYLALTANTTGARNTSVGRDSLAANTVGTNNTSVGSSSMLSNTTGSSNTAVGLNSLRNNTTGIFNTAVGTNSLLENTVGIYNTAVGSTALSSNTTGINNTAVGYAALEANTVGIDNTAVGYLALTDNTTGIRNTSVGVSALAANTIGASNTAVGHSALSNNTTGIDNTAVGYVALSGNTTGTQNTSVGYAALAGNTIGGDNTAVGHLALNDNTTGANNTAVGSQSLASNTTGASNTAIGLSSLSSNTIGTDNTATGDSALSANTTGASNTAVGYQSLAGNTIGTDNTAVGSLALNDNTTGVRNTSVGMNALAANTVGINNTSVGSGSLQANTTGINNTAVGVNALLSATTGEQNTAIGQTAASTLTTGGNVTCVGYNAEPTTATTINEVTLGNANVTTLRCATATITTISDERDKKNIADIPLGLEFIDALHPVRFEWDMRGNGKQGAPEAGFIAQELLQASVDFDAKWVGLVLEENPDRLEASPGKLIPIMVKAIQELSRRVTDLESKS